MDRGLRRTARDRCLADVVREAGRCERHPGVVAGLWHRDHRRRIRHRLQQCDDAAAGAAGPDRPLVRHRLGHRLCRRHFESRAGARLPGRESGHRTHAVRIYPAVRARSRQPSRRPHHRSVERHLVRRLRGADVFSDAGLSGPAARARSVARGIAGTLGAWLGGKLDDRLGPKRVIAGSMTILLISIVAILLVDKDTVLFVKAAPPAPGGVLFSSTSERAYLVLGCLIGMAGGPLQAASRTLLIRLAPKDRIAQYFGLFALTGKVTSFVGPLLIGAITAITESQKAGMAVLVLFFVAGLALLRRVREA